MYILDDSIPLSCSLSANTVTLKQYTLYCALGWVQIWSFVECIESILFLNSLKLLCLQCKKYNYRTERKSCIFTGIIKQIIKYTRNKILNDLCHHSLYIFWNRNISNKCRSLDIKILLFSQLKQNVTLNKYK